MPITGTDQRQTDDDERLVYDWRVEQFEKMRSPAGERFNIRQVHELAGGECDLRRAETLLEGGCSVETAFDILR